MTSGSANLYLSAARIARGDSWRINMSFKPENLLGFSFYPAFGES
jgi:hypothetical protein